QWNDLSLNVNQCLIWLSHLRGTPHLDAKDVCDGDENDHAPDVLDDVHHIYLGPPALRWSATLAATDKFRETAYRVMKQWIAWEELNLRLRPYDIYRVPQWRPNEGPWIHSSRLGGIVSPGVIADFGPRFAAVIIALEPRCTTSEAADIIRFIEFLRQKGIESHDLNLAEGVLKTTRLGFRGTIVY
ncbi:MAG: hypothetical protein ABSH09_09490, partial [Bryobacteraceae bacterium]